MLAPRFFGFLAVSFTAAALLVSPPADASWTKSETFEHSAKTSLKIVEPVGAKAFVTIGTETKESSLPAIFALPDEDAYLNVKIVAADGEAWSGKIEVKAKKQTVAHFTHVAGAAPAAADAHKFIGEIQNWTHLCSKKEQETLKFVVMKDGKAAYETTLPPNRRQANVELPRGTYSVRMFRNGIFTKAKDLEVTHDGWAFTFGCNP